MRRLPAVPLPSRWRAWTELCELPVNLSHLPSASSSTPGDGRGCRRHCPPSHGHCVSPACYVYSVCWRTRGEDYSAVSWTWEAPIECQLGAGCPGWHGAHRSEYGNLACDRLTDLFTLNWNIKSKQKSFLKRLSCQVRFADLPEKKKGNVDSWVSFSKALQLTLAEGSARFLTCVFFGA